ncbi:autotransporter outer membrane beta-barrel domain-containing protein [Citrobacter sp. S2-9]|uniref:Autotransporter outer membrane beta-barrel domain-containing protein n=1 Tax=Citrobacter enshiensis TaxID=2971264 RepID=A0ABT8PUS9_9ENTR|nr:autotransporter outer membrane beta-barrel domain-containing protein [Citrobacter enshiensis]MDN8600105.1 autotransporter outer membrane beta-barrel domain-containing protein [Citrobacter enshiensis]
MSLSVYSKKKKNRLTSFTPRLTLLSSMIGALLTNAYAAPVKIDGTEQTENAPLNIDTGTTTGQRGYAISVTNMGKFIAEGKLALATGGNNALGMYANNDAQVEIKNGATISTKGQGAAGISVLNNSSITVNNGLSVKTEGKNAIGVNVDKAEISIDGGEISTKGINATGLAVQNGGAAVLNNTNITTENNNARGVLSSGDGSRIEINKANITTKGPHTPAFVHGARGVSAENKGTVILSDVNIDTSGSLGFGVFAASGGSVKLENTKVNTAGDKGYGIRVDGVDTKVTATTGLEVITSGKEAHAVSVLAQGSVDLGTGGRVETKGASSDAIHISGGNGGTITGENVSIVTNADGANGIYVANLNALPTDPVSEVTLTGTSGIATKGDGAFGVWGRGESSSIKLDNVDIKTEGAETYGINAQHMAKVEANRALISTTGEKSYGAVANAGAKILLGSGSAINTGGDYAFGLWASDADTEINAKDTSINTLGVGADAVVASHAGKVTFNQQGGELVSTQGNSFSVSGGTILATLDGGHVSNNGTFILSTADDQGRQGNVNVSVSNLIFQGDVKADEKSVADLSLSNASWTGKSSNGGRIELLDENSIWNMTASSDVDHLNNAGSINLGKTAGAMLTVNGDYHGDNGHINFSSILGDDNSPTDKMVVKGDTSGTTTVSVDNLGGKGAATIEGIELIRVEGTSGGEFKGERIVAGAYDYSLVGKNGNWYLTSQLIPTPPEPVPPTEIVPPTTKPTPPSTSGVHVYRPEGGSYVANIAAANTLFNTRLHDRLGEAQYTDVLTGERKVTSMWMRQVGGHNNWRDGSGQLKTQENRYVIQLGGDIAQWSHQGDDRYHLGVMAGYGYANGHTKNTLSGNSSRSKLSGYSAGLYGTYYANEKDKTGLYVDSWAQYNWFNNDVNGDELSAESYDSKGITASLEAGYTFALNEGQAGKMSWYLQPQGQITFMNVKMDDHTEHNGTVVSGSDKGNVQTRLGVRLFGAGHASQDEGKDRQFQPFVEMNWINNSREFHVNMDGIDVKQAGARNLGEVKMGVEGQLNKNLDVWSNVGVQVGQNGYNDAQAMFGVKVRF